MNTDDATTLSDELGSAPLVNDALYREILDSAVDTAVIGTDCQGRIVTWSAGAANISRGRGSGAAA